MLLNGVENERFYFVHSYAAMEVKPADTSRFDIDLSDSPERVSWCSYGRSRFVAAYEHGPLSVTQFHPEKSGDAAPSSSRTGSPRCKKHEAPSDEGAQIVYK